LQARVLGEYAVAIVDERAGRAFLTHDGLGVMPLFYGRHGDDFLFGSHLEDLVALTGVGELDEEYLADVLSLGVHLGERTPYRHLRQLLPGTSLRWEGGRVFVRKTWDLSSVRSIEGISDEECEERLRSLLREGVTAALRADGPVWSELSGGLDSSSIVCTAAHAGTRLDTLSFTTRSRTADEQKWIRAVVERYDLPWHSIDFDRCPPFSEMPDRFFAVPSSVLSVAGLYRKYEELLSGHGVQVLLTGTGGDQVFCGDYPAPDHLADQLSLGRMHRLIRGVRSWSEGSDEKRSFLHVLLRGAIQPRLDHALDRNLRKRERPGVPPWLRADYAGRMMLEDRSRRRVAPRCRSVGQQGLLERLWPAHLVATGRAHYVRGFEFRYPLLYRPLVEFLFALPHDRKAGPDEDRSLQRRALRGILPETVRTRRGKMGPQRLYHDGLAKSREWLEALTDRPRVVERGYVDAERWREAVARMRHGATHGLPLFLGTATLEVWLRGLESAPVFVDTPSAR